MASLFSTYRTGENRVTASILAVMRSISLSRLERLLGAVMEESQFELVRFRNQVAGGGVTVPDAEIVADCRVLIETKIVASAVTESQIRGHLSRLGDTTNNRYVLVLTPDGTTPKVISKIKDERVVWASFARLSESIDELLADKQEVISEREAFLMRELQAMLAEEGLLAGPLDTAVVAARTAWSEYLRYGAYVCQPGRTFQNVRYLAFYRQGRIEPKVAEILEVQDDVVMEPGAVDDVLRPLVDALVRDEARERGESYKVFVLSQKDDPRTIDLGRPIVNDLRSDEGRPIAFTQGQRYVALETLRRAKSASELVKT